MIAHVAEAGEGRGRVVVQFRGGRPSPVALRAAVRVARAFQSEVESLFVEDEDVLALASFPFAREISLSGGRSRAISVDDMLHDMRLAFLAVERELSRLARAADVPLRARTVCDEPLRALARACEEHGPWNVVALAEPFGSQAGDLVADLLTGVTGSTGLVLVGPNAARAEGRLIAAVESAEYLPGLLRAAERIAGPDRDEIAILLVAEDDDALHWLDAQARLVLADRAEIRVVHALATCGAPAVVAEALRRLSGGFVIARHGGLVVPRGSDLSALTAALECPLLLVR